MIECPFNSDQIGTTICKYRKEKGWKQQQLAIKINLPPSTLSHIENGGRVPSVVSAYKLAKVFNISINKLLGIEEGN